RRLAAELAFRAHVPGHPRHLGGEAVQLVHQRVDRVLELEDLPLDVDGDLPRQVATCDCGRHLCDLANLVCQVGRHNVHVVGQALPGAGDAGDDCLPAQLALGAHFSGDTRHFRGEAVELVDHRVDGVLQFQDLALHVDRDLARQVAACDGGRDLGDVSYLACQVARHGVHVVGQVFPGAGNTRNLCLTSQLAFRADLASNASHFRGEPVQLVHQGIDGVLEFEQFALDVDSDLPRQVAARDGGGDLRDAAHLVGEVRRHHVYVVGQVLPG